MDYEMPALSISSQVGFNDSYSGDKLFFWLEPDFRLRQEPMI